MDLQKGAATLAWIFFFLGWAVLFFGGQQETAAKAALVGLSWLALSKF